MEESIQSQLLFYFAIVLILFLPGYSLLLAFFGRNKSILSPLERFVFSFGLGIIITDFIAFFYSRMHIPISSLSSILGALVFSGICFGIYKVFKKEPNETSDYDENLFDFSKNQLVLIFLFLFLTIFIKTAYLSDTVSPTSTDMGHHMYWTSLMTETGQLPSYDGMPDFIIGEHIALSELSMISSLSIFSALPVVFLFMMNILGILTVFLLTLRCFKNKNVAIFTLLFLGVLFAISSPQAKFVSGGVMGNILGNYFLPLALYFYLRAFSGTATHYSRSFLSLAILISTGLFYTHHLTAFIFLFILVLLIILYLAANYRDIKNVLQKIWNVIFSFPVIATFAICLTFFFFVFTPSYMQKSAVETAVGAPSKSTREGLSLNNLKNTVGEARLALGLLGLLILVATYKRKGFEFALVSAWAIMLLIMSTAPQIIFINLPSARIGNYTSYPLAILSAYGLFSIFNLSQKKSIPPKFLMSVFLLILIFVLSSGLLDSAQAFKKSPDFTPTLETFDAAKYLVRISDENDTILKDHNYLSGDTWMKLFFMRGYTYPLSRSYFKRYEDATKPREMCTLHMISNPSSEVAQNCFSETGTNYIAVNPRYDSSQFKKLDNFDAIYANSGVIIYLKN